MLEGATALERLARCEDELLKPFSILLTSQLLDKLSKEETHALASLILQARFEAIKDYSLVIRNSAMFACIYLGSLFEKLGFPFNFKLTPEADIRDLILSASTETTAQKKLADFLKIPHPDIIKILLPFYHDYVRLNPNTEKQAENFMGKFSFTFFVTDVGLRLSRHPAEQGQLSKTLNALKSTLFKPYEEALKRALKTYQQPILTPEVIKILEDQYSSAEKTYQNKIIPFREKLKHIDWSQYIEHLQRGSKFGQKILALTEQVETLDKSLSKTPFEPILTKFGALGSQFQFLCRVIELTEIWEILAVKFEKTDRGKEYDSLCTQIDNHYTQLEESINANPTKNAVKTANQNLTAFLKDHINKAVASLTPLHRLAEHLTETQDEKTKTRVTTLIKRLITEGADGTVTSTEFKLYPGIPLTADELLKKHNCPPPTLWQRGNSLKTSMLNLLFPPGYHREDVDKDEAARRLSLPSPRFSPGRRRSSSNLIEDKLDLVILSKTPSKRQTTDDAAKETRKKYKPITVQ